AGQIDMIIDSPTITLPQVRAGTIKAYAVAAESRLAAAPDIPTVDEAGLPGFYISGWSALWAPKGTPKNVIAKLTDTTVNGCHDPPDRPSIADIVQELQPRDKQPPEALRFFKKAEIEKWWPIIKAAGIKAK